MTGLEADSLFFSALLGDEELVKITGGRIFDTARTSEAESEDRIPYIIITLDGVTADSPHKDIYYDAEETAIVSVMCCTQTREALSDIMKRVLKTVKDYVLSESNSLSLNYAAGKVMYDFTKPCYFQTMTFSIILSQE